MKMAVVAVGKLKDRGLEALVEDYRRRASRHIPTRIIEVRATKKLLGAIPKGYKRVALDERGESISTRQLAATLDGWMQTAVPGVAWLIGGADGLDADTKKAAHWTLALSPMTFPHRLARVILCEQLYQALSLLRGEPYHK